MSDSYTFKFPIQREHSMNVAYPLQIYVRRFFTERFLINSPPTPNTVATYRDAFRLLLRFVEKETGRSPNALGVEHIDADLVKRFVTFCEKERGNSASSSNTRLSAIRSFFRYVGESEPKLRQHCQEVRAIPNTSIGNEQDRIKDAGYLTWVEIEAFVSAPDRSSWLGRRDWTLLVLMLGTGLRISEAIGLRLRDVEFGADPHVRCNAGSPKERKVPLPPGSAQDLQNWVRQRRAGSDEPLFVSTHGKALSRYAIQRLVRKHAEGASKKCPSLEKKRVTPHVLRRTFARQLMLTGEDFDRIRRLLGHRSAAKEADVDTKVELQEGATGQTHSRGGGYDRSVQKDELLEYLDTL